jgi:hypothetical protein
VGDRSRFGDGTTFSGVCGQTLVATNEGVRRVAAATGAKSGRVRELVEVVLRNGLRVAGTANHCVLVGGDNKLVSQRLDASSPAISWRSDSVPTYSPKLRRYSTASLRRRRTDVRRRSVSRGR